MTQWIWPDTISGQAERDPPAFWSHQPSEPVLWCVADAPVAYPDAVAAMEERVADIASGTAPECVWLVEHPALYTAGTSALDGDLVDPRFPVHRSGRGGRYTYHGPGQRVVYVLLDLRRRRQDIRAFVETLEDWVIGTLADLSIRAVRRDGRVGVWVPRPDKPRGFDGAAAEDKIAAIGVRLRRWVSFHGLSLNVDPDLTHFGGIVPCGIAERHLGVTSLVELGHPVSMPEVDSLLRARFAALFGPTIDGACPGR